MFKVNKKDTSTTPIACLFCSTGIYLLKVNNRSIRTRCEICSKLTIKTSERRRSGVFIVNFEHISYLVLVFFIVNFEHVTADWARSEITKLKRKDVVTNVQVNKSSNDTIMFVIFIVV